MIINKNEAKTTTTHFMIVNGNWIVHYVIQIKNVIIIKKHINVNVKIIINVKNIIVGILAHVFVRIASI